MSGPELTEELTEEPWLRRRARRQVGLIALVLVLTMATWFAASAVAPALRTQWALSSAQVALLTTSVQLGFVAGAVGSALLNLPDLVDAARLAAGAAVLAAASTAAMTVLAHGLGTAVALRFVTGMALAGVYPVGMKLASSWFQRGRGLALGVLIGALTVGSALPQLIGGSVASAWRQTLDLAAALSLLGAAVCVAFVRLGPYTSRAGAFRPSYVLTLVRERGPRLANLGYLGHMWELYAAWVWLPTILAESLARHGSHWPRAWLAAVSFGVIGICGGIGCLAAGWAGERFGRATVAALAMTVSGGCCLVLAAGFGAGPLLFVPVLALWGASVIADSALFSACLSSVVDRQFVGTALTMQTAAGFLLTIVTIQGVPLLVGLAGWRPAIAALGLGPLLGAPAMRRLAGLLPPDGRGRADRREQRRRLRQGAHRQHE